MLFIKQNMISPVLISYLAPSDYSFTSTTVQLTPSSPVRTISVSITDDSIYEQAMESFTVGLSGGGSSVLLQDNVATINIMDNDGESLLEQLIYYTVQYQYYTHFTPCLILRNY